MRLLLCLSLLFVASHHVVDFLFESLYLSVQVIARLVELLDLLLHLSLALLSLQRLAHAKRNCTFVKRLVSLNNHLDFVANTNKEETALGAVNSDLPNKLIEALCVQFFSDRADSCITCLSLLSLAVEVLLQVDHIDAGSRRGRHVLHPELAVLRVLARRQNGVEEVLVLGSSSALNRRELLLLGASLLSGDGG